MGNAVMLFGAGASFGSQANNVPPLGDKLFSALALFDPQGWGRVGEDLALALGQDFERGMSLLAERDHHALPRLQRGMAAFFFRYWPGPDSLYRELARRVKVSGWSGALVTLNYERLLEGALVEAGVQPAASLQLREREVEMCLPHGCCHLFCDGIFVNPQLASISGTMVQTDGPIIPVFEPGEFERRINSNALPPVMSYFEPSKHTTAGRSFIQAQRARWGELARDADTIVVIGLRVRTHDEHIWGPLAATPARLIYCSGASAGTEFRAWAGAAGRPARDLVYDGTFRDHFEDLADSVGLGVT